MLFDQALDIPESLNREAFTLALMSERLRYSLRLKKSDLAAIKKSTGLKFPSKIGKTDMTSGRDILCLGPDEWLIVADVKEKAKLDKVFAKAQKDFVLSITDISHRNVGFVLCGLNAARVINVGWRSFAPYMRDFFTRIIETHA